MTIYRYSTYYYIVYLIYNVQERAQNELGNTKFAAKVDARLREMDGGCPDLSPEENLRQAMLDVARELLDIDADEAVTLTHNMVYENIYPIYTPHTTAPPVAATTATPWGSMNI